LVQVQIGVCALAGADSASHRHDAIKPRKVTLAQDGAVGHRERRKAVVG
jgi:hypothetical protein